MIPIKNPNISTNRYKELLRIEKYYKEYRDKYFNSNHEIKILKDKIEKAIDFLKENACIDEDMGYFCDDLRYDDCKTLLEILKGDDKE